MIRPMRARATAVVGLIACATIFAGCSSSKQADSNTTTSAASAAPAAADSAAATAAATTEAAAAAPADDAFPIYPDAKPFPIHGALGQQSTCGHKMAMKMYEVAAADKSVIDWYKSRLSNAVMVDMTGGAGDDASDAARQTLVEIFQRDGSGAVTVMQMHFASATLQAASKTIDADKTTIGYERFDPPLGNDYVQLVSQAASSDSAVRTAARTKLAAECPSSN